MKKSKICIVLFEGLQMPGCSEVFEVLYVYIYNGFGVMWIKLSLSKIVNYFSSMIGHW